MALGANGPEVPAPVLYSQVASIKTKVYLLDVYETLQLFELETEKNT